MPAPSVFLVFLAGMATVITPCVLPILPAVLSGSVGSRLRPVAIVSGFSVAFALMGVLISAEASFSFFNEYLRWFAIFFIIGMGGILLEELYEKRRSLTIKIGITGALILLISIIIDLTGVRYILIVYTNIHIYSFAKNVSEVTGSSFILASIIIFVYNELNQIHVKISSYILNFEKQNIPFFEKMYSITPKEGLLGSLILGMSLGVLWIPTVGRTLSSVFTNLASSTTAINLLHGIVLLLVYSLGFCIPVIIIVYSAKRVSNSVSWFLKRDILIKKFSGLILILIGLILSFRIDLYLKAILLPYFPIYI